MTDIAKRLREIAGDVLAINPREAKDSYAAQNIHARLGTIAAELESQPAGDTAMPVAAEEKPPEHVCGSSGFGGSVDDVCHACRWWREKWALDGKTVPMRDHLAAIAAARQERVPDGAALITQEKLAALIQEGFMAGAKHGAEAIYLELASKGLLAAAPKPDTP